MKSLTTSRFRKCYTGLPLDVQKAARKSYDKWKENSKHPSLQFKQIHKIQPIYSIRISLSWRALGVKQDNIMI